tara:strand:+ start:285 stop:614 length:330 start_codon:yes stop_codon:yes gene_type:complete
MPNNFKRAFRHGGNIPANSPNVIYRCPSTPTTIETVGIGLVLSNIGSSQILVSIEHNGCNNAKNLPVPSGSTLEYFGGNKICMNAGDDLSIICDTANSLDAIFYFMEIT